MHGFSVLVFTVAVLFFLCVFFGLSNLTKRMMKQKRDHELATELAIGWWFFPKLKELEDSIESLWRQEEDAKRELAYNELLEQIRSFDEADMKNKTITELHQFITKIENDRRALFVCK